ncbi:Sensory transduction histidine kinase [Methanosarcina siciliae HI350]|uniref:Sensory transduction histidine kinase n=1 Tax=Methanosarcina siciliae HI350 TaxID=1434119 RepID=A0A0E3PD46_9EURY|nr:PAS domain S-box protein [Methanosarcina siciliae]AKB31622.1 Sensory transduction histidine kinase [Methanosarcina siciliae HI350]
MEKKVQILLFEDNPGDANLIEELLEDFANFPFELKSAETLNEGLDLLKEHSFDVILSDLRLPDSDGIDTFLEINGRNSRTPIIILTGMNDEKTGIEAVKKGAQDYLVKGQADGRLLVRSIRYSIERKKAEEKAQSLANIVESSNDGIVTESLDGIIVSWNKGAEQIYGYSAEEILGKHMSILAHPLLVGETKELVERIKKGEKIYHYETSMLRKDGMEIKVSITLSPVFGGSENLTAISIISRDITEKKKAEEELLKSEERVQSYLQNFRGIGAQLDENFVPIFLHGAVEELTGYAKEDFLSGKLHWREIVEPEDIIGFLEKVHKMEVTPNAVVKHEYRIRKKDGEIRWIHEIVQNISEENKELYQGFVYDITERKMAEEALVAMKESRIKEIHHRIKNNLQVISSLLDLQAEKFEDPTVRQAFRESQNRVISMALIHEELYESGEIGTLNFAAYLQKLVENIFECYNIGDHKAHLHLEIEEKTFLDMDTAVPLGIIVNELVSNSFKHAFPERDKGMVKIRLCREENRECKSNSVENTGVDTGVENPERNNTRNDNENLNLILTISDNGVGIPESVNTESPCTLGLQLVTILVDQLDGKIELKIDSGTEFIIKIAVKQKQ